MSTKYNVVFELPAHIADWFDVLSTSYGDSAAQACMELIEEAYADWISNTANAQAELDARDNPNIPRVPPDEADAHLTDSESPTQSANLQLDFQRAFGPEKHRH